MTETDADEWIKELEKDKAALNAYALVVKSKDEDSAEYHSAEQLQKYLLSMTGKSFEIITPEESEYCYNNKCHYIVIGENSLFAKSPYANYATGSDETYFVKSDLNTIVIGGGSDRGVVYGVYEFLRSLGVEFYASDCEYVPSDISYDFVGLDLDGSPSVAMRHYLEYKTCYSGADLDFTAKSGLNTSYAALTNAQGGMIEFGSISSGTHNARFYVGEEYWGTVYCPANANVDGGFVPCLTNGVDYNTDRAISTFLLVKASMKGLIKNSPNTKYFTFEQEDGEGYCTCDYCNAAAEKYGRSGVLVRFCNKLLEELRADGELSGREFKIVTFAYSYTVVAPTGGVSVDKDLCIWYAEYSDMRYSLLSENQNAVSPRKDNTTVSYKECLKGWKNLTAGENSGSLILWLYDASYNNYLSYFGTTMTAIDGIIDEVNEMNVEMLLVLGAYDADNIWQSEMRSYIWSRKMFDSTLKAKDLRDKFIEKYFGSIAADSVKEYCDDYDGYYADNDENYPVKSGNEYYGKVTVGEHCASLQKIKNAIDLVNAATDLTDEQKTVYLKRLYGVEASSYASILHYYDDYYTWLTSTANKELMGGGSGVSATTAKANFTAEFKDICAKAGITRCHEGTSEDNTVEQFISDYIGKIC